MRHSRMWLALHFREPEGPPPSSFQAATVQSKLSLFFAEWPLWILVLTSLPAFVSVVATSSIQTSPLFLPQAFHGARSLVHSPTYSRLGQMDTNETKISAYLFFVLESHYTSSIRSAPPERLQLTACCHFCICRFDDHHGSIGSMA
jgi:hypothetical protein